MCQPCCSTIEVTAGWIKEKAIHGLSFWVAERVRRWNTAIDEYIRCRPLRRDGWFDWCLPRLTREQAEKEMRSNRWYWRLDMIWDDEERTQALLAAARNSDANKTIILSIEDFNLLNRYGPQTLEAE